MYTIFLLFITFNHVFKSAESFDDDSGMDLLLPYKSHHGPRHDNRYVRSCQQAKYGNMTHSLQAVYRNSSNPTDIELPLVESRFMMKKIGSVFNERYGSIHYQLVKNPWHTLSILEPLEQNGCDQKNQGARATVLETAKQMNCLVAVNAGFFNTHTGECLGNIVSNERLVKDSEGIQNAHFGITKNGMLYVGYLSEIDVVAQDFVQLVGGVIWLVRDGKVHVDDSVKMECSDTQETGNFKRFVSVISARTAVGHDKEGRVILIQVDGQTDQRGVSLYELANIMIELGAVNAINLDGGGSATLVINGTLVNQPSDMCDKKFRCARKVSTVLCVHEPVCDPPDCNGHGQCVLGQCNCSGLWVGLKCLTLKCDNDCSGHGLCTEAGCKCDVGWMGTNCSAQCSGGRYGLSCNQVCLCQHNSTCNPVTGTCSCPSGFVGDFCQRGCPFGYYGERCEHLCMCPTTCGCDHITGSCSLSSTYSKDIIQASKCIAQHVIKEKRLVVDKSEEYRFYVYGFIFMSAVATVGVLSCCYYMYNWWKDCVRPRLSRHWRIPYEGTTTTSSLLNNSYMSDDEDEDNGSELKPKDQI